MRNSNISDFSLTSAIESTPWQLNRFSCPEHGLEIFERNSWKNQLLICQKVKAVSPSSQVEFIPETDNPEAYFIKME